MTLLPLIDGIFLINKLLIHLLLTDEIIYRQVFCLQHILAYELTQPTIILPADKRTTDEVTHRRTLCRRASVKPKNQIP